MRNERYPMATARPLQGFAPRWGSKAVAADFANAELSSLERASKGLRASVQALRDFLHRVLREQFPRLLQLFLMPATVIVLRLDAVLDNESPAFFLCAAGLTLELANELGKFVS